MKPLSTADFGKVMKQVYPRVRPRRLGTRGNSRYCYAGLRKRLKLEAPVLPDVSSNSTCYASSDLVTAAWCVVKEWAEALLGAQFVSLQALASHLVEKVSVNTNTMAACLVASSGERNNNNNNNNSSSNSKHRETQMQLQRKLQQKEAKRKLQQIGGSGSGQHALKRAKNNQVCDKTADLTTLPERKQTTTQVEEDNDNEQKNNNAEYVFCDNSLNLTNKMLVANAAATATSPSTAKLPIPRLVSTKSQQTTATATTAIATATATTIKKQKTTKYKTIQPKPAKCDKDAKGILPERSQMNKRQQHQRFMGNVVDKDALDDYLISGSNSQEQEEELLQYFNADNSAAPPQVVDNKLSQLRLLLQQNYKAKLGPPSLQARRRVSFETQQESSVPPSPNTRRKNFSFTPISPGPLSPSTASPFVSPRNTPVPKTRRLLTVESAPPSPMQKNQLKTSYFPNYSNDFFADPSAGGGVGAGFRSQSVPLGPQFAMEAVPAQAEFADFETSLNDTGLNTENFNKILNILDNSQGGQQLNAEMLNAAAADFGVELQQANVFQFDGGFAGQQGDAAAVADEAVFSDTLLPNLRNNPNRGQSTRSVPSTPLPSLNLNYINNNLEITSRSYPSTPTDTMLRYGQAHAQSSAAVAAQDFLLNGQPVKELFGSVDEMMFSASPSQHQQLRQDNKMVDSSSTSSTTTSYQNCNYGYSDYVPSNGHSNV